MSTPVMHGAESKPLDVAWVRAQFPSLRLQVNGYPAAFLDGPAGTQVPKQVMDAVQSYFLNSNANTCGASPRRARPWQIFLIATRMKSSSDKT